MKLKYLALATCVAAAIAVPAQTSQRITAGKASEYGLVYTLPVTALDITIEAELTHKVPGEFHNYARRNLSISDAITAESREARIVSVTIVPRGVPDDNNRWTARFKAGATPYMILNEDNIPLAINTPDAAPASRVTLPVARKASPTPLETEAARQAITQEMARSSSVSKRAELAAQRIFELRETRSDLLSGQADNTPPDGQAMKLVMDNLAAQEAALTAMFAGTTSVSTVVGTFTVLPDSTVTSRQVLARLSVVDGLVDADDLTGTPVYLDLSVLSEGQLPVNDKGEAKTFPKGGVAYNIPGTARAVVTYRNSTVADAEVPMAQLGITFGLDPALFADKKAPSMVRFDSATGGILLLGPAVIE